MLIEPPYPIETGAFAINPTRFQPEARNILLNGRNNLYDCPEVVGSLSIKTMPHGQAVYRIGGARFVAPKAVDRALTLTCVRTSSEVLQILEVEEDATDQP